MKSKLYIVALVLFLALAVSTPTLAQDSTTIPSSDPNAAGASSQDGYTINVDLPQAVIYDVTITDTLPQGLIYKSGSLQVCGAEATSPEETVSSPNDGSQAVTIIWRFGQVNNSAGQGLTLKFQPIVADVASNQDGTTLAPNQVSLQYKDNSGAIQTVSAESDSVKLVEPDLDIELSASPAEGKAATYTAYISHSSKSDADAFDSDLSIVLPSGIVYSPGSAKILSGPEGGMVASPGELKWHFAEIDRSWNGAQKVMVSFNATAEKTTEGGDSPGEIVGTLSWKSASGDGPGTRSYVKSQSLKAVGYVSDYAISISQIADPDPVRAGQILVYAISYANNGQFDVHGVTISDIYDNNVTFISSLPTADSGRTDLWTVGDMKPGETGAIKIEAKVNPYAADGTLLKNVVRMASKEATTESIAQVTVKAIKGNQTVLDNKTIAVLGANNTSSAEMVNNSENNTTIKLKVLEIIPMAGENNTSTQVGNNLGNNTTLKPKTIEIIPVAGVNNTSTLRSHISENNPENNTTIKAPKPQVILFTGVNNESTTGIGNNSENNATAAIKAQKVNTLAGLNNESFTQLSNNHQDNSTLVTPKQNVSTGSNKYTYAKNNSGNSAESTSAEQIVLPSSAPIKETNPQLDVKTGNTTPQTPAINEIPASAEGTKATPKQADVQPENNGTITLNFGTDIKVDLVVKKAHFLSDYVVIDKSNDKLKDPSALNQANSGSGQTKLGANQSNTSNDQTLVASNISGLATGKPEAVSNQTTLSANQSDLSEAVTPAVEVKSEFTGNQSNTASNTETNQSAEPKGQTPAVESQPAIPSVQTSTASNQTETGSSQQVKPKDQTSVVESKLTLPSVQISTASNQTETGSSQPAKSIDQTPVEETKPTIQANQVGAVQAQLDNAAVKPDTSNEQSPVVESNPSIPANEPPTGPNLPSGGVITPDTPKEQSPVVESKPAPQPIVDLNQTK